MNGFHGICKKVFRARPVSLASPRLIRRKSSTPIDRENPRQHILVHKRCPPVRQFAFGIGKNSRRDSPSPPIPKPRHRERFEPLVLSSLISSCFRSDMTDAWPPFAKTPCLWNCYLIFFSSSSIFFADIMMQSEVQKAQMSNQGQSPKLKHLFSHLKFGFDLKFGFWNY